MNDIANSFLPNITVKDNIITDCNDVLSQLLEITYSNIIATPFQNLFSFTPDQKESVKQFPPKNNNNADNLLFMGTLKNKYNYQLPVKVHCQTDGVDNKNFKLYFQVLKNKAIDVITDLPNGWAMFSRASYLLSVADKVMDEFIIIILSVDNFSTINYRYGYDVGDDYLAQFGKKLSVTAGPDALIVRFSNSKFGILITNQGALPEPQFQAHIIRLCDKICLLSGSPFQTKNGFEINKYFSIGISKHSTTYESYHAMEIATETALLEAKKYSISKYSIATTQASSDFLYRKFIIDELPEAIEKSQIKIHYQPQYDLNNQQLIGFEALSEWNHKVLGNIPAETFVAIAEDIALHFEFDLWVFTKVCLQVVEWEKQGIKSPTIAINVSFKTLEMTTFIPRLNDILEKTRCPTSLIELEITETTSANNLKVIHENIIKIKTLGINIAVDDFGSGYSSLSLIRTFHLSLHKLKIDRSLIENICNSTIDREFAQKVIELGKVLNLKILAEGVENIEQYNLLKKLGCDFAQGFYFDKALLKQQAEQLINHNKQRL
jgi:diguanylate cyclase (GGDEF)-like protein